MGPNPNDPAVTTQGHCYDESQFIMKQQPPTEYKSILGTYGAPLKWFNVILIFTLHIGFICGCCIYPFFQLKRLVLWNVLVGYTGGVGITGGAHRLWTHRSFKAKLPLRIILMLWYCASGHNPLYHWVRDHRVHHKYSETDADPHNAKRGFFFAHVGWLMMKKHPEVIRKGKQVDMSDIREDPVIRFHMRYFVPLVLLFCFIIPISVPPLLWGEDWMWSSLACLGRYVIILNFTWLVNSAAHLWGNKPYDKGINPSENLMVSIVSAGEGWHNYHHTFPWDYKAAELGSSSINGTTFIIDMFAKIGWAYDLKVASADIIKRTVAKGDGSHPKWSNADVLGKELSM